MSKLTSKTIVINTIAQSLAKTVVIFSGFISVSLLASQLGTVGYGNYATVFSILGIVSIFGEFGLDQIYIRMAGDKSDDYRKKLLANFFGVRIILLGIFFFIILFMSLFLPFAREIQQGLLIASPIYILNLLSATIMSYFQTRLEIVPNAIFDTLGRLMTLVFLLFLSYLLILNIPLALAANIAGSGITFFLLCVYFLTKNRSTLYISLQPKYIKLIAVQALPVALVSLLNQIFFRIDIPLLSHFRTASETGIYAFAYRIFEFSAYPASFLVASYYPILSQHKAEAIFWKIQKNFLLTLTFISVLILVAVFITFSYTIAFFPALSKYASSEPVLHVLLLALPFLYLQTLYAGILILRGKTVKLIKIYALGAGINVLLNTIFIPGFGATASAWITVVTQSIVVLPMIFERKI